MRAAADAKADGRATASAGLGFVGGEGRVVAHVAADVTDFVVAATEGADAYEARLVSYDAATGLGLLAVPELTVPPYVFARDAASVGEPVHGAVRAGDTGVVTFVSGSVLEVRGGTATDAPAVIRHDAYSAGRRNAGGPLLNGCGQLVGAVVRTPDAASTGSEQAAPAGWLRERFGGQMGATTVGTPCMLPDPGPSATGAPPDPAAPAREPAPPSGQTPSSAPQTIPVPEPENPVPEPENPVPEPENPVPEPENPVPEPQVTEHALGLSREDRRLIELGLTAADFDPGGVDGRFDEATRSAISLWQTGGGEEPTGFLDRQATLALLLLGRQQETLARAERQGRYARWTAAAAMGATVVVLFLWFVDRRSVAKAERPWGRAAILALAARPDMPDRNAGDQPPVAVPGVLLDAIVDDEPLALRIPGAAISVAGGAVVGRNPFDSTVVLDHVEVSRRHFRLFAADASVMIEDLNSMNGTKMNDVTLVPGSAAPLASGAVLHVGSLEFSVTLQA